MGADVGVVPLEGRAGLPFLELHGHALLVHAVRALTDAGLEGVVLTVDAESRAAVDALLTRTSPTATVEVTGPPTWWADAARHRRLVLVDPLCPLVPASFVAAVLARASGGHAHAGYRPVTDTVKTMVDDHVEGTLDRSALAIVTAPVVFDGRVLAGAPAPPVHDFGALAGWLRTRGALELVEAPPLARRVGDEASLRVLEALAEMDASATGG